MYKRPLVQRANTGYSFGFDVYGNWFDSLDEAHAKYTSDCLKYGAIEPENTFICFWGSTAGESHRHCLRMLDAIESYAKDHHITLV